MLDVLDADAVHRWFSESLAATVAHRSEIDALNVYPVPDKDTGTNLLLTLRGALATLTDPGTCGDGVGPIVDAMAHGAVLAAKGNSGVLLSQWLRGFADAVRGERAVGGPVLARALRSGAEAAYAAVAEPAEGTILSVARAAGEAASRATGRRSTDRGGALADVARAAAIAAASALGRTPQQLPVLARAGVVDAGGRGLVLLFDALVGVVAGTSAEVAPLPPVRRGPPPLVAVRESGSPEYGYEVQYLLEADPPSVERLRHELAALGDSLAVVGTAERLWNVHVHVNDAGAALEAGVAAGRPFRVTVTRFADESRGGGDPDGADGAGEAGGTAAAGAAVVGVAGATGGRGAVAVCAGKGLSDLFRAEGAAVVEVRDSGELRAGDVLGAIRGTGARDVVVLPNGCPAAVVDEAVSSARREGSNVAVVPTRSPVQGLAALSVRDPRRRFADDVILMAEAAGATRCGELTRAAGDALTSVGTCRAGDVLGLADGDVVVIGDQLPAVTTALLDRLLAAGGELVTVVLGAEAAELRTVFDRHVRDRWPMVEAVVYDGGQSDCLALVGVE